MDASRLEVHASLGEVVEREVAIKAPFVAQHHKVAPNWDCKVLLVRNALLLRNALITGSCWSRHDCLRAISHVPAVAGVRR